MSTASLEPMIDLVRSSFPFTDPAAPLVTCSVLIRGVSERIDR
jgi:hypothetical protein